MAITLQPVWRSTWCLVLGWGFRLSLDFFSRGLQTRSAVARNPCVSYAFLLIQSTPQFQFHYWLIMWQTHCVIELVNFTFFLTYQAARNDQFRTGLRFTRDVSSFFFLFHHSLSQLPRPIALKLCHVVGIWLNFIIPLYKFGGGHSPEKIWGQKHAKFRSILDYFRLWSRISPERLNISKIGRRYKLWQFLQSAV